MNEELKVLLKDRLKKELQDVIEYDTLYNVLKDEQHKVIIEKIANDEYDHASIMQEMIDEYGIILGDEYKELWRKAKECFN